MDQVVYSDYEIKTTMSLNETDIINKLENGIIEHIIGNKDIVGHWTVQNYNYIIHLKNDSVDIIKFLYDNMFLSLKLDWNKISAEILQDIEDNKITLSQLKDIPIENILSTKNIITTHPQGLISLNEEYVFKSQEEKDSDES